MLTPSLSGKKEDGLLGSTQFFITGLTSGLKIQLETVVSRFSSFLGTMHFFVWPYSLHSSVSPEIKNERVIIIRRTTKPMS